MKSIAGKAFLIIFLHTEINECVCWDFVGKRPRENPSLTQAQPQSVSP